MRALSKAATLCAGGFFAAVVAVGVASAAPRIGGMGGMGAPHMGGMPMGAMNVAHMHMGPGHIGHHHHFRHGAVFGLGDVYVDDYGYGGCGYEYSRWQATGSHYWRNRYYDCAD